MGISNIDILKTQLKRTVEKYNNISSIKEQISQFRADLIAEDVDAITASQITMLLELSNIGNYVSNKSISNIDINNCIINIEEECGFSREFAQDLASVIFYSFGFDNSSSYLEQIKRTPSLNDKKFKLNGYLYDLNEYEKVLNQINNQVNRLIKKQEEGKSISDNDLQDLKNNTELILKLSEQGHPTALCIRGKCYLYGIGTEKVTSTGTTFLHRAAIAGNNEASSALGDYYYDIGMFSTAFQYYTKIGATVNNFTRQTKLASLIENKKINIRILIGTTAIFLFNIIYLVLLMTGKFCPSGCTHYPTGIVALILSTVCYGLIITKFFLRKYDLPRLLIIGMALTTLLFSFIALVL